MARGATHAEKYRFTRRILTQFTRRYNGAYKNGEATGAINGHTWRAYVNWGNMSNGESVGTAVFIIDGAEVAWSTFSLIDKLLGIEEVKK